MGRCGQGEAPLVGGGPWAAVFAYSEAGGFELVQGAACL